MPTLIKIGLFILAIAIVIIVFIHLLPVLLVILAVCAVIKLYHWFTRPRDNRTLPPWPWRDS